MALDPRAKQVWLGWEQDGYSGGLQISLGSLEYLGIKPEDVSVNQTSYTVPEKTVNRPRYPGGPVISYKRKAQTITRIVPGINSTAKSGRPMYLEGKDGTRDTIRVTGNRRCFAKWLKAKVNMGVNTDTITLQNWNGAEYATLHRGPQLPIVI